MSQLITLIVESGLSLVEWCILVVLFGVLIIGIPVYGYYDEIKELSKK